MCRHNTLHLNYNKTKQKTTKGVVQEGRCRRVQTRTLWLTPCGSHPRIALLDSQVWKRVWKAHSGLAVEDSVPLCSGSPGLLEWGWREAPRVGGWREACGVGGEGGVGGWGLGVWWGTGPGAWALGWRLHQRAVDPGPSEMHLVASRLFLSARPAQGAAWSSIWEPLTVDYGVLGLEGWELMLYFAQYNIKGQSEIIAQSCTTLCDLVVYTVDGILQARILEWVAVPFSRGSS